MNLRAAPRRCPPLRTDRRRLDGRAAGTCGADVVLDPQSALTPEQVERLSSRPCVRAVLSPRAEAAMRQSCETMRRLCERGAPIYGVTTGFGPFVRFSAGKQATHRHGLGLVNHLCAGFGPPAASPVVRAAMLVRARAVVAGHSAVSPEVVRGLLKLLEHDIVPEVPEVGSVGASGDLIPLAFVARALHGLGEVRLGGRRTTARTALRRCGIKPLRPAARDVLGLVNGTSFMTAYASLAVCRAVRLLGWAERLTGWAYRLLGCRAGALDDRLHQARGHPGQRESARAILSEAAAFGPFEDPSRPLQEVYSLRCAPQFLGACRDQLAYARHVIQREINGVNDNPLFFSAADGGSDGSVVHGGNFQGQQIAFASDAINAAVTQMAVLAERQIDTVLSPVHNGGAPLLLAWEPGPCSGLAGAQITATAVVADMRQHAYPAAVGSIPTNGGNQDVVSMGTNAARHAWGQTPRCAAVLAVLALSLHRLSDLRDRGRAPGPRTPLPTWLPACRRFARDVPLHGELDRLARILLETEPTAADGRTGRGG